ncbi:MAG TPA: cell division protein FtsB [Gammaproteobacteria bacterium]|uniref:septum formation initiator family protein n=1 Tax=Immundisolibacter sp. TaxID=1934948 RepID=UPI000E9619E4|nr:cell division protein FtsB [Gammaproteobacteria bacterium]HCZ48713.1 cell division protein FtsB [Gammaproteobacteria bacterium]MCH78151.1 cell division protein FtsB [Gammaproteobacteria bacterium]
MPLRVGLLALLLALAGLQYRLLLAPGNLFEVQALKERVGREQATVDHLAERNGQLAAEVEDLRTGLAAVEDRARAELGMIRPGETFIRVIE